jgi:hypothetical protein
VKTDKVDAATLASLYAAGYLPEIWTPDAATERMRRLVARRYQVVRRRTRIKNEVHAILHAHLIPRRPHADLFNRRGRNWLADQPVPEDERTAIERHVRELDRLEEDLAALDRGIARDALEDEAIERLLTITGVNLAVAAGLMAAIGSVDRFSSSRKLVSYFGLNPRVRQSGLGAAHHGRISKAGRSHARAMLVEGPAHAPNGRPPRRRGRCAPSSSAFARGGAIRSRPSRSPASSRRSAGTCSRKARTTAGPGRVSWLTSAAPWNWPPGSRRERATGEARAMRTIYGRLPRQDDFRWHPWLRVRESIRPVGGAIPLPAMMGSASCSLIT